MFGRAETFIEPVIFEENLLVAVVPFCEFVVVVRFHAEAIALEIAFSKFQLLVITKLDVLYLRGQFRE